MKKYFLFIAFLFATNSVLTAQTVIQVSTGTGYAKFSYYKLNDGATQQVNNDAWDIAFSNLGVQQAGIFVNESTNTVQGQAQPGVELFETGLFDFTEETVLREFAHWVIIKNRFPYDNVAKVNDMLVSRRPIGRHYDGSKDEEDEYHTILKLLAREDLYDALIENFPNTKSVKKFAHTHLIVWRNS